MPNTLQKTVIPAPPLIKPTVLALDDEILVLTALRRLLKPYYKVLITDNAGRALDMLRDSKIDVVISDQRMPAMTGVEFLSRAKTISPNTVRLLLTGYSDVGAIQGAINDAEIYRFISKPWKNNDVLELLAETSKMAKEHRKLSLIKPAKVIPNETTETIPTCLILDYKNDVYPDVKGLMGKRLNVNYAANTSEAIKFFNSNKVAVFIVSLSNKNSDEELGFTKALKQSNPKLLVITITESPDSLELINLINEGQIYRILAKPIRLASLKMYLLSAIKYSKKLNISPHLVERHKVEPIKVKEQRKFADKFRSILKKIF